MYICALTTYTINALQVANFFFSWAIKFANSDLHVWTDGLRGSSKIKQIAGVWLIWYAQSAI